jgi:hypothetical protein
MGATMKKLTPEPYTKILSTAEPDSSLILIGKSTTLNVLSKRRYFHLCITIH